MKPKRVKVGDVEIGLVKNPNPAKNNLVVYSYRPRTNEYLSRTEVLDPANAEYLFSSRVDLEKARQADASAKALEAAIALSTAPDALPYENHPLYARF